MHSWVLSTQLGKAAAVLVTCKHGDSSVAEVLNCGSRRLNFLMILLVAMYFFFTAVTMGNTHVIVRVFCLTKVFFVV